MADEKLKTPKGEDRVPKSTTKVKPIEKKPVDGSVRPNVTGGDVKK